MHAGRKDSAGVRVPPPLYFVAGLLLGWLLTVWFPIRLWSRTAGAWIAVLLFAAAAVLAVSAISSFRRAGTTVLPDRASSTLVFAGPYRFTRNPMYISMSLVFLGIALVLQSLWALLLLPVVLWAIQVVVIRREEAYLERAFGEQYARYKASVRRWF